MGISLRASARPKTTFAIAMNWFRENPFWSAFIAIAGGALLSSPRVCSGGRKAATKMRWRNIENLPRNRPVWKAVTRIQARRTWAKMKTYLDSYKAASRQTERRAEDAHVDRKRRWPLTNSRRVCVRRYFAPAENARNNRVKLPANFFLGFDEFVSSLPLSEKMRQRSAGNFRKFSSY